MKHAFQRPSKRLLDLLLATIGLATSSPLSLLIPLAIRLEDGGSVFYTQDRWGQGERIFRLYKFRTMKPPNQVDAPITPARTKDQRVTRVGRVLRASGMDELPQLINILRGEMSVVGPRALAV